MAKKSDPRSETPAPPQAAGSVTLDFGGGPFDVAIDSRTKDVLDALDREFFDNLAAAGKRPLSQETRELMQGGLVSYLSGVEILKPTEETRRRQDNMRGLAKRARALAAEIERVIQANGLDGLADDLPLAVREDAATLLKAAHPFRDDVELPLRLHMFADNADMYGPLGKGPGNRTRKEDDILIRFLAEIYHRVGGCIAVSETGPFAEFLRVVWQVLPDNVRGKSANTFVMSRAKGMVRDLQKHTQDLPRNLAGVEPVRGQANKRRRRR